MLMKYAQISTPCNIEYIMYSCLQQKKYIYALSNKGM